MNKLFELSNIVRLEVIIKEEEGLSLFTKDSIGCLLVELTNDWVSMGINKRLDSLRTDTSCREIQSLSSIIETSIHDNT
jgi:hypothetical protein